MPKIRQVSISFAKTVSKNYNSFKIECGMVADLEEGETSKSAFDKLSKILTSRINTEIKKAMDD